MRKLLEIMLIFILSSCSMAQDEELADVDLSSRTPEVSVKSQPDISLNKIRASYASSAHASEFSCEECHPGEGEVVFKELISTDKQSGRVATISSPQQLCAQCHPGQAASSAPAGVDVRAHAGFECLSCHDPHGSEASCTNSSCHADIHRTMSVQVEKPKAHPTSGDASSYMCGGTACHEAVKLALSSPVYHQPVHRAVPCYVCHDKSGSPVTLDNHKSWVTINTMEQGVGETPGIFISHAIVRDVDCSRCHYVANPWKLIEILPID
jgi:hypothetical protein